MLKTESPSGIAIILCTALSICSCQHPERVTVIKILDILGDYQSKDYATIRGLCLAKRKGSISEEAFQNEYKDRSAYLVSGPAVVYSVSTQIDERRKHLEEYQVKIPVHTYLNGVAMNDGDYRLEKRTREVATGKLRYIYGKCAEFEYHFK